MKIDNPLGLVPTGAPVDGAASPEMDQAGAGTAATRSRPVKAEGSATVTLSGEFGTPKASANAAGAFDAKRVEQRALEIANGSFSVDARVVATNVISSNLEALARSKS